MMVMIRGVSLPSLAELAVSYFKEKKILVVLCFERLDLIFAQAGHRILCLIVSHISGHLGAVF